MPEDRIAEGDITKAELVELAGFFDASENSFDPASDEAAQAKAEFDRRVAQLFEQRVAPRYRSIKESVFRAKVRSWCREYRRRLAN